MTEHRSRLLTALLASTCLAAGFTATPVVAQDTAADDNDDDVILVTARKREESLQDVPLAITAFTAEDIAEKSLKELEDVALLTPGFTFEDYSNGGFGTPVIRGATQFSLTQLEQNVSVFLDGVYIPRQYAFDIGLINLERVEVVKGPQSALYGSNAFAGAVNYVSINGDLEEFSVIGEANYTEDGGRDVSGAVNLPVIPGVLSIRASGGYSTFDGAIRNSHPNASGLNLRRGTDETLGGHENYSLQAGLTFQPTEAIRFDGDYYHFDVLTEQRPGFRLTRAGGDTNCSDAVLFGFLPVQQLICGEISATPVPGPSGVEGFVTDPRTFGLDADTDVFRGQLSVDLTDNLNVTYLFGHIEGNVFSAGGSDRDAIVGTPGFGFPPPPLANVFSFIPIGDFNYDTHEVRVDFDVAENINVTVGGFFSDGDDFESTAFGFVPLGGTEPAEPPLFPPPTTALTETDIKAVFARVQASALDDKLVLGVEGRYTDEQKTLTASNQPTPFTLDTNYFTPRVSLDYSVNDNMLVYASAARGVKSGGINNSTFVGLIAEERFFDPDTNWTYELGAKNTLLNGAATLNATLFFIDWSNLQTQSTPTGAPINTAVVLTNIGAATSKGVEIEGALRLSDYVSLDAGFAYIDAEYDDGVISARILRTALCDDIVCNANGDIGGNQLPRSSDIQWNVGASGTYPISNAFELFGRVDVAGQSEQFVSELNVGTIEPRTLTNLRVGVRNDNWSVSVWAKNVFDKRYVSNAFFIANPFQVDYVPTVGNPRRIGVTLRLTY